jgi:hypothetical protein
MCSQLLCQLFLVRQKFLTCFISKKTTSLVFRCIFFKDLVAANSKFLLGCLATQLACLWGGLVTVLCPPRNHNTNHTSHFLLFPAVFRIRIHRRIHTFLGLLDPHSDL